MQDEVTKLVLNWSSGKDAALAYSILNEDARYKVTHLLTTVSREYNRIVMHGIREELLDAQADAMRLPLKKILLPAAPDDTVYRQAMERALTELQNDEVSTAAFGDIFLEDLKRYREEQLKKIGFDAVFPLWKRDTKEIIPMLEERGIEAMIVCVNEKFLGKEYLGRKINSDFLDGLPAGVDPCGEHGEFHSFVYNTPYFAHPIPVIKGEITYKNYTPAVNDRDKWDTGFYFLDLMLAL